MGLLGDCRDFSPAAEKAYAEAVPTDAADFCGKWNLGRSLWRGSARAFYDLSLRQSHPADCRCGQAVYPIPLYVNAWLSSIPGHRELIPPAAPLPAIWTGGNSSPRRRLPVPDIYRPTLRRCAGNIQPWATPCSFRRRAPLRILPPTCSQLWANSALWVSPLCHRDCGGKKARLRTNRFWAASTSWQRRLTTIARGVSELSYRLLGGMTELSANTAAPPI